MKTTLTKGFLTNRDETGRFIVKSMKTGKVYFVEPIDDKPLQNHWGDVDIAAKKLTGDYGQKYQGSVKSNESLITEANGFQNILLLNGSPFSEIERREEAYLKSIQ
ncbi:MAG: hypothetical protein H6607_00980 [Flavobacteriales bacterium]|nr:hypothetical protein [Flavobacteriales bacterium]